MYHSVIKYTIRTEVEHSRLAQEITMHVPGHWFQSQSKTWSARHRLKMKVTQMKMTFYFQFVQKSRRQMLHNFLTFSLDIGTYMCTQLYAANFKINLHTMIIAPHIFVVHWRRCFHWMYPGFNVINGLTSGTRTGIGYPEKSGKYLPTWRRK
jgi:hypothetical protein